MYPLFIIGIIFIFIGASIGINPKDNFEIAKKIYKSGNYYETIEILEELIDSGEKNNEIIVLLKKARDSKTIYNKNQYSKANSEFKKGNYDNSLSILNSVIENEPDNIQFIKLRDKIVNEIANNEEKRISIERQNKISNFTNEINYLINKNQFEEAKDTISEFIEENEELGKLSSITLLSEKIVKAQNIYNRKQNQIFINKNYGEALKLYKSKNYDEAIDALENIFEKDSKNLKGRKLLSKINNAKEKESKEFWATVKKTGIIVIIVIVVLLLISFGSDENNSETPKAKSSKIDKAAAAIAAASNTKNENKGIEFIYPYTKGKPSGWEWDGKVLKPYGKGTKEAWEWNGRIIKPYLKSSSYGWEWNGKILKQVGKDTRTAWIWEGNILKSFSMGTKNGWELRGKVFKPYNQSASKGVEMTSNSIPIPVLAVAAGVIS